MAAYYLDGLNIATEYGLKIERVTGLLDLPKRKGATAQDWPDSDGEDPFVDPADIFNDARDIILHCYVRADSEVDLRDKLNKLRQKLSQEGLHSLSTPHYPEPLKVYCKQGFAFNRLTKLNGNGTVVGKLLLKLREPEPLISTGVPAPAITPGNGIRESGLVGYFPFNLNARDFSGEMNDGTVNGATLKTGNIDTRLGQGAYRFAINDFITIDSVLTNELASITAGTIEAWIKPDNATPASQESLIVFGDTDANEYLEIAIKTDGKLIVSCRDAGIIQWILETDAPEFSDDEWTHIAVVQDGSSPILYINGSNVSQTFTTSTDKTKWFNDLAGLDSGRTGCSNYNGAGNAAFFNGVIDEVKFYNRALSANEVNDRYNFPKRYSNPVNINTDMTTSTEITIKSIHPDATIIYTTDGTDPTKTNGTTYSAPFTIPSSKIVKAIAILDDEVSPIATEVFIV